MGNISLFEKATDPLQYELGSVNWAEAGGLGKNDPHRRHFLHYVEQAIESDWAEKSVLDIGAGTGWLIDHVMENGAAFATGLDPSSNNIAVARQRYGLNISQDTIETYNSYGLTFDVAVAIYVLFHIDNLDSAFEKIASWLNVGGKFITIVPDLEYAKCSRADFDIEVEQIHGDPYGAYTVRVQREHGAIADIVRDIRSYEEAARRHGLIRTKHIEMKPSSHLLEHHERYHDKKDTTLTHLLEFTKVGET